MITIDEDKCDYCLQCVEVCRSSKLTEKDGELAINNGIDCYLCESCMGFCEAITLTLRNGQIVKSKIG